MHALSQTFISGIAWNHKSTKKSFMGALQVTNIQILCKGIWSNWQFQLEPWMLQHHKNPKSLRVKKIISLNWEDKFLHLLMTCGSAKGEKNKMLPDLFVHFGALKSSVREAAWGHSSSGTAAEGWRKFYLVNSIQFALLHHHLLRSCERPRRGARGRCGNCSPAEEDKFHSKEFRHLKSSTVPNLHDIRQFYSVSAHILLIFCAVNSISHSSGLSSRGF